MTLHEKLTILFTVLPALKALSDQAWNRQNSWFLILISLQKWLAHFYCTAGERTLNFMKKKLLNLEKRQYLLHCYSDKGLQGNVSKGGGSLMLISLFN